MRREHLLLGILLATAIPAFAQRPVTAAQDVVPKELALALVRFSQDGGDILVGSAPADLAQDLPVPTGGRILGSFVSPSYVQIVMTFPGRTDSALAFARRALVDRGWVVWQPPLEERGGLTSRPPSSTMPNNFCRAGGAQPDGLSIAASFYGPATSLLRVTRSMSGLCSASMREEARRSRIAMMASPFATVPTLNPPPDSDNAWEACRTPSTGFHGSASQGSQPVRSTMSASELLAYFGRQLESAGWYAGKGTESVVGKWTKNDSVGTREVTLAVAGMPNRAGCYNVELTLNYD